MRQKPHDKADVTAVTLKDGFFKKLADNMQIGVIVSDADGFIVYMNDTYARFLNLDPKRQIGKHATAVVADSRLHIVAKTQITSKRCMTGLRKRPSFAPWSRVTTTNQKPQRC